MKIKQSLRAVGPEVVHEVQSAGNGRWLVSLFLLGDLEHTLLEYAMAEELCTWHQIEINLTVLELLRILLLLL